MIRKRLLVAAYIAGILFFCFGGIIYCGTWLLQGADKPTQAQAIVILAGDPSRSFYAADLYLQGLAPEVYISKPIRLPSEVLLDGLGVQVPRAEEINRQVLQKKGVPAEHIHFFGSASISTSEEALELRKVFPSKGAVLLVVTSPYHVRRSGMILRDVFKDSVIVVVPTTYESFPKQWWTTQDSSRAVVTELIKLLFYTLGGRFHS